MWVFLAYGSAGIRLGLECLLVVSAEENMRFHIFSKIRAFNAALSATTHPLPSALLGSVHLETMQDFILLFKILISKATKDQVKQNLHK